MQETALIALRALGFLASLGLALGLALRRPSGLAGWTRGLGRGLLGFAATAATFALASLAAAAQMEHAKTFACLGGRWFLSLNYAPELGVGLCALPALAAALAAELWLRGHRRALPGRGPAWRGSLLDVSQHAAGAACACMCALAFLGLLRYAKMLAILNVFVYGLGPLS